MLRPLTNDIRSPVTGSLRRGADPCNSVRGCAPVGRAPAARGWTSCRRDCAKPRGLPSRAWEERRTSKLIQQEYGSPVDHDFADTLGLWAGRRRRCHRWPKRGPDECGSRHDAGTSSAGRRFASLRSLRNRRRPEKAKPPRCRSYARVSGVIVTITLVAPTGVDPVTSRFSVVRSTN